MEPISAAASILGVIGAIASVTSAATTFMRDFKSARKEIVALKKELAALKAILEILADDLHDSASTRASYPDGVVERIGELAANCNRVVNEIGGCVRVQGPTARLTWATTGKANVERLRGELEAHKSTLSVTLDLVSVIVLRDIKNDTEQIRQDTSTLLQGTGQIQSDVNRILVEISRLQVQLSTVQGNGHYQSSYVLERFLGDLKSDTETVLGAPEDWEDWPFDSAVSYQEWSESVKYSSRGSDRLHETMQADTQQAPQPRRNQPSPMEYHVELPTVSELADGFRRHFELLNSTRSEPTSESQNPGREEDPGVGGIETESLAARSTEAEAIRMPHRHRPTADPLGQPSGPVSYESSPINGNTRKQRKTMGSKTRPTLSKQQEEDPAPITFVDSIGQSYEIPYKYCRSYADLRETIRHFGKCPAYIREGRYSVTVEPYGRALLGSLQGLKPGTRAELTEWRD